MLIRACLTFMMISLSLTYRIGLRAPIRGLTRVMGMPEKRYLSGHRFWSETVQFERPLNATDGASLEPESIDTIMSNLTRAMDHVQQTGRRLDVGIVFAPKSGFIIPIHDGNLQRQHLSAVHPDLSATPGQANRTLQGEAEVEGECVLVCGFSPRASHVVTSPDAEERPLDPNRLKCLNEAISRFEGMSPELLMSDEYAGTPPARIYRSFVAPRPSAQHMVEPTERAANRTAAQIDLALRQVKADRSTILRNTDRPLLGAIDGINASLRPQSEMHRTVNPVLLVLDNLRSAFNVGSIFRSAETAGVMEVITCGITAHPPNPKLRKTAMSALEVIPTMHREDTLSAVKELKAKGVYVVCLETTDTAEIYSDIIYPTDRPVALVVGNEVTGVDIAVMENADAVAEIPTFGVKNSLNVAAALPVVLFEVIRQRQLKLKSKTD